MRQKKKMISEICLRLKAMGQKISFSSLVDSKHRIKESTEARYILTQQEVS